MTATPTLQRVRVANPTLVGHMALTPQTVIYAHPDDADGPAPDSMAAYVLHDPDWGWTGCLYNPDGDPTRGITTIYFWQAPDGRDCRLAEHALWHPNLDAMRDRTIAGLATLAQDLTGNGPRIRWQAAYLACALDLLAEIDPDRARTEYTLVALAHPHLARYVLDDLLLTFAPDTND